MCAQFAVVNVECVQMYSTKYTFCNCFLRFSSLLFDMFVSFVSFILFFLFRFVCILPDLRIVIVVDFITLACYWSSLSATAIACIRFTVNVQFMFFLCITELNVVRRSLVRFWSSTSSYNDIASTIFRRFSFRCISFGLSIGLRCRKTIILIHSVCKHMRKYCAQTQRRRQVTCPWQRSCNRNTNMKNSHIISKRMSANSIASFALMVRALYAVIVLILWQKRHQSRIFHIPNSHLMPKHLRRRWNETKRFKCEAKRVNEKRWQPGETALKRKKRRISNYNQ